MKAGITEFYKKHLPEGVVRDMVLTAECPFCKTREGEKKGKMVVFLNAASFFYGYFRCLSQCMERGYAHRFASLLGLEPEGLPPLEEDDKVWQKVRFPLKNINVDIEQYQAKLAEEELPYFALANIGKSGLRQVHIGYNGRYIVYPYYQIDGNCYSARCVHPERQDDYFWYGDVDFGEGETGLFNVEEIKKCAGGSLFLCEGEESLLAIKQMGFPGIAYWDRRILEKLDPDLFASIRTLFIIPKNSFDSIATARITATRIGFKVRILKWPAESAEDCSVYSFAVDRGQEFPRKFGKMLTSSRPFSPFATPEKEYNAYLSTLSDMGGEEYRELKSGFPLLDERLGGIHGINIFGGGPKVGKSCFMIQIASMMAAKKIPVLYYDFENGRQRIYQRTFTRLSRIEPELLLSQNMGPEQQTSFSEVKKEFKQLLRYFRVINDRKVSPEVMRRHIDFLRHETQSDYTVVVIDSLHKLPFKDLSEMRTGIDSWLRQLEAIRDELRVSFLVISELSRGESGTYEGEPHMGAFKGSGDIEYSADNAMVLLPHWDHMHGEIGERENKLWLVGSREHRPGLVGSYYLEFPYWSFREEKSQKP